MEWTQLAQIGGSFVFVIALMLCISWLFKKLGLEKKWGVANSTSGLISVEDTMFLDAKRRVMVLGMEQKRYVVLLDAERAQLIDTLERAS